MSDQLVTIDRFEPGSTHSRLGLRLLFCVLLVWAAAAATPPAGAQAPEMLDARLKVRTIVSGLSQPTNMAFLGPNDFLVLEKATGRVQRVTNGAIAGTVLDLAVNSASERGLLGIALHPQFPVDPSVYLFWSESSTGADSNSLAEVALLGNRVDRFVWNGSTLTLAQNIIRLRAFQADAGQPLRGNHNGGVIRFGPDEKLYIITGEKFLRRDQWIEWYGTRYADWKKRRAGTR